MAIYIDNSYIICTRSNIMIVYLVHVLERTVCDM